MQKLLTLALMAGVLVVVGLQASADPIILTPQDYQVLQRGAGDRGAVAVSVRETPGREVRARLQVADPSRRGQDTDWVALAPTRTGYAGEIHADAGGWYQLQVESAGGDGSRAQASVAHVGIGEVFIVAGQSNAACFGETPQRAQDDRVVATDGRSWRPAVDPIAASHGDGNGSPWPILGDMLASSLQVPVAFADIAVGGSHTCHWLPATRWHYPRLLKLAQRLGRHGVRCVLWHQGEADTAGVMPKTETVPPQFGREPEQVYGRMRTIIRSLDEDLDWHLPWMVAQVAWGPNQTVFWPDWQKEVRAGQALLWQRGVALRGPTTDDLIGRKWRSKKPFNTIHFNSAGLHAHAQRWYARLMAEFFTPGRQAAVAQRPAA